MKKYTFLLFLIIITTIIVWIFLSKKQKTPASQYEIYCGSCHLLPDPKSLPKSIWEKKVLPEMAARMGYKYNNYNPYRMNSMEENLLIRLSNTYPKKSLIDSITWLQIHDYVLSMAPDSLPDTSFIDNQKAELTLFNPSLISLNENRVTGITSIQFNRPDNQLFIGDALGTLHEWQKNDPLNIKFNSPIISYIQKEQSSYLTEIGYMNPSEKPLGTIYRIAADGIDTLSKNLHRPVYTEITDLDEDGINEIIICEFGNLRGQLSLLVQQDSIFEKRILLPIPGAIKVEIADMNNDGAKDIVALFSQGQEGIYIFYQEKELHFKLEHVIKMEPEYGSSWFELLDYNSDGHLDIVIANGDNADYSNILKPYHGVRLFINDSKNKFEEKWFYPIHGATRVLVEDFDQDGDSDFAVLSFFPDFANSPEESFIYLENIDPINYIFEPHVSQQSNENRWLVMDKGDFDQDGDVDIMLGGFFLPLGKKFKQLQDKWRESNTDLLFLENNTHR
jgi:VCBS repeat protein